MSNLNEKFITFEGPEGSGKSTQIKLLYDYLVSKGEQVVLTKEPGGTKIGSQIRNILLDVNNKEMDSEAELLLYAADRAQHIEEVIMPALKEGKWVLCDRYIDSNVVYQGIGRGIEIPTILKYNQDFILPSKTFILMLLPEEGLKRKSIQNEITRFEQEDIPFHNKIYKGFGELKELYKSYNFGSTQRFITVEGMHNIETVFSDIKEALQL